MRLPGLSLIISLCLHGLFVCCLKRILRYPIAEPADNRRVMILLDKQNTGNLPRPTDAEKHIIDPVRQTRQEKTSAQNGNENDSVPGIHAELNANAYTFLHLPSGSAKQSVPDSLSASLLRSIQSLSHPREDPAEQWLRHRTGRPETGFRISDLVPKRSKKIQNTLDLDFIPTDTQIRALHVLYENGPVQDTDLYPRIQTEQYKTYDQYRHAMDHMVNKGLISRKKVSPEHLFILFVVPVEINSKNRKNLEYQYEPLVPRETLIDLLQARRYALMHSFGNPNENVNTDSSVIHSQISDVTNKLKILLQDTL